MLRFRNYWSYSAGLAIAWAINLLLTRMIRGREGAQTTQLVFFSFCIGWVSTTIARYVYPPPGVIERNEQRCRIHWRFNCADAHAQMHDLYPCPNSNWTEY